MRRVIDVRLWMRIAGGNRTKDPHGYQTGRGPWTQPGPARGNARSAAEGGPGVRDRDYGLPAREREITRRWIWLVPSTIWSILASRM
ncbi:hypothetical protein Lfu02_58240 [Longispora fulva]|nr:hypothetical protein Lfu02_58240 [Longispora fulva]